MTHAQEETAGDPQDKPADQLTEVVVTGYRSSLEQALEQKRQSVSFVDSITAEDVGKLPDNNLAEAIQRVPGVQISRTNGEGQQISLRGLGPSFARVLLDGMPVSVASEGSTDQFTGASPNREFDFDMFPSELFNSLSVEKTSRAGLVEGGLAGTINLRNSRPFDFKGLTVSYSIQEAYSDSSKKYDPRGSFLVSNTWNDRFGALIGFAMTDRTYRTDGYTSQNWARGLVPGFPPAQGATGFAYNLTGGNQSGLTNAQLSEAKLPRLARPELQTGTRDRIGATAAFQLKATDRMTLNLDVLYSKLDISFDRYTNNMLVRGTSATTNTPTGFGWITPRNFTVDDNNTVVSGTLDGAKFWSENRVYENNGDFRYVGLGSDWLISDAVQLDWKVSRATSDWDLRHTTLLFLSAPSTTSFTIQDGLPVVTPGIDLADPNNWAANQFRVQPRKREEQNDNFLMNVRLGSDENNIRTGLAYNKFSRDRRTYNWSNNSEILQRVGGFPANTPITSLDVASLSTQVPVTFGEYFDTSPGYTRWLVADLDALGQLLPYDQLDALAPFDPASSGNIEEKNYALFLETNLTASVLERDVRINAGLRAVRTNQDLGGFIRNGTSTTDFTEIDFRSDYQAYLPSFNVAVDITDQIIGRFAASRSMTRASPGDLEPLTSLATGTAAVSQGNPNLDPYFSDQFDIGAEWYFSKGSVIASNLFYKDISGFIELFTRRAAFREAGIPLETLDPSILAGLPNGLDTIVDFTSRRNSADRVQIKGAELLYQQPLDMLLRGFGINANYTRLQSSGDRPVTGLAKNNFNIVAYFERDPYNLRLSYNYRSDYVECSSRNNCQDNQPDSIFREAAGYLDLSTGYGFEAFGQKLAVSFEALNILNEEEHSYFGTPDRIGGLATPRRQFLLGLRGSF